MSRAYASVFAGFVTFCLGLIAMSSIPVGLPTALNLAFGENLTTDQLGIIELLLMVITAFLSVVFVTDGVISMFRGRGETIDRGDRSQRDDIEWVDRFVDSERGR